MKILIIVFSMALLSIPLVSADEKYQARLQLKTEKRSFPKQINTENNLGSCPSANVMEPLNIFGLNMSVVKPMDIFACMGARGSLGARFTTESCKKLISCRQNIENSGAELNKGNDVLNAIIARDYIKNSMVMNGDDMERLEVLTKFAQKKYDSKLGAQCLSRFQSSGKSECNFEIIEDAFEERQKNCKFGIGCYNLDNVELKIDSFEKFKKENQGKYGKFTKEYFKYRTEKTVESKLYDDDKIINELASLAANPEFKKAKNDQKINLIINTIGRDTNNRLKDPILGYEFGNENPALIKNADKFKDLLKLMDSKASLKDVDKNFAKDFEIFRRKKAETILNGANICSKTNTLLQICNEASNISKGVKIKKDAVATEHLTSFETEKGMDFLHLKDLLGPKFREEDYDNLLNAKRCVAFGYVDDWGVVLSQNFSDNDESGSSSYQSENTDREEANGRRSSAPPTGPSAAENKQVSSDGVKPDIGIIKSENLGSASESSEATRSLEDSAQEYSQSAAQAPQVQIPSTYSDMFSSGNYDAFGPKAKGKVEDLSADKAEDVQANSGTSTSQERMNEYLMKKLAAAEENLEKLKADTQSAEEDRVKQKKIDEEAALIKDLKGQISDLKTQSAKSPERKAAEVVQAKEQARVASINSGHSLNSGSSVITTRSEASVAKVQPVENFEPQRSSTTAPVASSSRSGSNIILSSTSNSDGSRTTTLGSGLVVTTVDGMTSEKAQLTISNRILELNGTPFYIEEGGMVKEIIAVVKDGKVLLDEKGNPVFEKIVKGKVGDKKFAAKLADKKGRAPASITDVADLKRDQEEKLKRERAEYLKLKNLTNGALKKK